MKQIQVLANYFTTEQVFHAFVLSIWYCIYNLSFSFSWHIPKNIYFS